TADAIRVTVAADLGVGISSTSALLLGLECTARSRSKRFRMNVAPQRKDSNVADRPLIVRVSPQEHRLPRPGQVRQSPRCGFSVTSKPLALAPSTRESNSSRRWWRSLEAKRAETHRCG